MSPPLPPLPPAGPEYSLPFKWSQRTTPLPPLPARASIVNSSTSAILKEVEEVYRKPQRRQRQYFKKRFDEKFKQQVSPRQQYKNLPPSHKYMLPRQILS